VKTLLLTFALASSLAACGTAPQPQGPISPVVHTDTQEVKVAVPVLCVTAIPKPRVPLSTVAELRKGSGYQVVMKYDREIQVRDSYESDLIAALTGCLKGPVQPQTGSPGGSAAKK
jgi:predicted small lipoprotein YifL